jgi:hypothetical protein
MSSSIVWAMPHAGHVPNTAASNNIFFIDILPLIRRLFGVTTAAGGGPNPAERLHFYLAAKKLRQQTSG